MTTPDVPWDVDRNADTFSIYTMVKNVLARIVEGYQQAGVSLPERQYCSTGTPAVDCAQLVVVFKQAYLGPPGDEASEPQRCDTVRSAALEVHLSRCIPAPKGTRHTVPTPESIEEAAALQMQDAWLLLDLAPITESWDPSGPGGMGVIATVEAGEPQGGFQTTVLSITMAIP